MTSPLDLAIDALERDDLPAAGSWARAIVADDATLADRVVRTPIAARAELDPRNPNHLLFLLRLDPDEARKHVAGVPPGLLPALALAWDPDEAARLVLATPEGRWPRHITATNAYRTWAEAAWRPIPLHRLRPLAAIGGDSILMSHATRLLWRGIDIPVEAMLECLENSRHADWCAEWIDIAGKLQPRRLEELLGKAPSKHLGELRSLAGTWTDDPSPDAVLRRALRTFASWPPGHADMALVSRFVQQRWPESPEACRAAIPFISGGSTIEILADIPDLEAIDAAAADAVIAKTRSLTNDYGGNQAFFLRVSDTRWPQVTKALTPAAARGLVERACSLDPDHPRLRTVLSIAALQSAPGSLGLYALASASPDRAREVFDAMPTEEQEKLKPTLDLGFRRAAAIEGTLRLIDEAVNRRIALRSIVGVLLGARSMPQRLLVRAFRSLARADDAALAAIEPYLLSAFDQTWQWPSGSFVDPELRRVYRGIRERARRGV